MARCFLLRNRTVSLIGERPGHSPSLQSILAGLNILSSQEYENVLSTRSSHSVPGDALIQCKLLTSEQVLGPIREQILEMIYEIFEWRGARYRFEVTPVEPERRLFSDQHLSNAMEFPVQGILMEVARREDEWHRIREAIPHAYQIYQISSDKALNGFVTPEIPDKDRMKRLLRLFDGETPLSSVLESSSVPAFYVFSILRMLLEKELATTISVQEKKTLVNRLSTRRQADVLALLYRSILEESPGDDEIRRRLVKVLEKKRDHQGELIDHYHVLTTSAQSQGKPDLQQSLSLRQIELAPRDLAVYERIILQFGLEDSSRSFCKVLTTYVEQAARLGQDGRAAEFLLQACQNAKELSECYEQTGDLFARQGNGSRAAEAYEGACRNAPEEARETVVRRVAGKLRKLNPELAERSLQKFGVESKRSSTRWGPVPQRLASICVIAIFCLVGMREWRVSTEQGSVIVQAKELIASGDPEAARFILEEYSKSRASTVLAFDVDRVLASLQEQQTTSIPPVSEVERGQVNTQAESPPQHLDYERVLSEAQRLRTHGDFDGAWSHLKEVDLNRIDPHLKELVRSELSRLTGYLESASQLARKAEELVEIGDLQGAGDVYQELLNKYPHCQEAMQAQLPLFLDVLPRDATLILDGKAVNTTSVVRVPANSLFLLEASAPGFESTSRILDPRKTIDWVVHLQKNPTLQLPLSVPIEAAPIGFDRLVILGGRDGHIRALEKESGREVWTFQLPGIGEIAGELQRLKGHVAFSSSDGAIYLLDASDGRLSLQLQLPRGEIPRGGLTQPDSSGRVAVVTNSGHIYGVELGAGHLSWQATLSFEGGHSPTRVEDRIIVSTDSGSLACLSLESGELLWTRHLGAGLSTGARGWGNRVAVGTHDRRIIALTLTDGALAWELAVDSAPKGDCVLNEDKICTVTRDGTIVVAESSDGSLLWSSSGHPGFLRGAWLTKNCVFTIDEEGRLMVHRSSDGSPLWSYRCNAPSGAPLFGDGETIVVIDAGPTLHLIPVGTTDQSSSAATEEIPSSSGQFAER